ncbi:MAG: tetratricopeptide repeat protein [Flavobacteriales bacterium]|nr:tetratricopeptide repeat protein [Flavobacteriales bacterium]MCB9174006.1 tetratricopeptide repeat protein [Flavobacteriales bacterium]MCB9365072.1 tetratricopeptide repeat protein [Flavobacteriales bacterium]MCB9365539.1 tetratricopeptide repeat protein [Flavobacteriales bacterium]
MKKTVLTITTIVVASLGFAQKAKVVSAYNYNKAFERSLKCSELVDGLAAINEAINDAEAQTWAKTWYYRGNLYFNVLASKTSKESCVSLDADALEKCTDSYMKAMVLNFQDPELKKLDLEKDEDVMKFMMAIKEAFEGKIKVDDETYNMDIISRKIPGLSGEYGNKGIGQFQNKDYKGAQESFGKSLMLGQFTGKMDTMMMYNTALASELAGDNATAKQVYEGLIMLKYNVDGNGPNLYMSLSKIYKKEGDTAKADEIVKKGRKAYPNDYNLIVTELDGYLASGKHQEALTNLDLAITNNPKNEVLYFARGTVYENLKNEDKAVADYKKAIEIKPDYYDAHFNLGAYFFNKGAEKINEANALPYNETKKFEAMKLEAKKLFETSIPSIEKANELNPKDVDTANMLIKVYTQTEQYDKAKAIKAKYQ